VRYARTIKETQAKPASLIPPVRADYKKLGRIFGAATPLGALVLSLLENRLNFQSIPRKTLRKNFCRIMRHRISIAYFLFRVQSSLVYFFKHSPFEI
jgi:hypothetical protein